MQNRMKIERIQNSTFFPTAMKPFFYSFTHLSFFECYANAFSGLQIEYKNMNIEILAVYLERKHALDLEFRRRKKNSNKLGRHFILVSSLIYFYLYVIVPPGWQIASEHAGAPPCIE